MNKSSQRIDIDTVAEAIADIAVGKPVIVVDDEDRENEGDLIMAAEKVTPEWINFFASRGRGLICTPVDATIARRLGLSPMVTNNEESHRCDFTVSVDLREGIASGISASDRAKTIARISEKNAESQDFVKPGHVFPLLAKTGGVLVRAGHTEAAVDLARLAGLAPAGVLCEIMNEDGTMARLPQLKEFAKKHDLKLISIEALIAYRRQKESLVEQVAHSKLPTVFGEYDLFVFRETLTGKEHVAMVLGDIKRIDAPLVRVHSECLTGDVFRSVRCDCRSQLDAALERISEEGAGILLRMAQEGRGIGLEAKIKAYALQDEHGFDTVEANNHLGFEDDLREYGIGAQILIQLGVKKMRLLTNNPRKIVGLSGYGISMIERTPIQVGEMESNTEYLKTKRAKLGHLLD